MRSLGGLCAGVQLLMERVSRYLVVAYTVRDYFYGPTLLKGVSNFSSHFTVLYLLFKAGLWSIWRRLIGIITHKSINRDYNSLLSQSNSSEETGLNDLVLVIARL